MIDWTQIRTAADIEADAFLARAGEIKSACKATIYSVVDQNTQASLLAAVVAGTLTEADMLTFRAGQAWIEACKAESRAAIMEGRDPVWPDPGAAVRDIANRY